MLYSPNNSHPEYDEEGDIDYEEDTMIAVSFGGGTLVIANDMIILNGFDKGFCKYAFILSVDDERMPAFLYFSESPEIKENEIEGLLTRCAYSYTGFDYLMETLIKEHEEEDPYWRPMVMCNRIRNLDEIMKDDGQYTYGMPFVTHEDPDNLF